MTRRHLWRARHLPSRPCRKRPAQRTRRSRSGNFVQKRRRVCEAGEVRRSADSDTAMRCKQDPRFGEARTKLADSYLRTGDIDNAYRQAVRAADLLPDDIKAQIMPAEIPPPCRPVRRRRGRARTRHWR